MLCEDARELLPVYIGGGLCENDRRSVAAHLAVCAECRRETALLVKLKATQYTLTPRIPESIRLSAFNLISSEKLPEKTYCLTAAHRLLLDTLGVTRSTVRLTYRLIRI